MTHSRYQPEACAYCTSTVLTDQDNPVPAVDDDDAWAGLIGDHDDDCPWIATRAHRVNVD